MGTNSNKLVRLTKYIRNTLQPSDNPAGGLPLPTSSRTACRACPGRAPSSPPRAPLGSSLARCLIRSSDVNISNEPMTNDKQLRTTNNHKLQTTLNDKQQQMINNAQERKMTNNIKQETTTNNDKRQMTNKDIRQITNNKKRQTLTNDKQ